MTGRTGATPWSGLEEAWEGSGGVGGRGDDNAAGTGELERRLARSLLATCRGNVIRGGFLRFVNSVLQFFLPLLLNSILLYFRRVQSGEVTEGGGPLAYYRGYWLLALLMAMIAAPTLTEGVYFYNMNCCSWR